MSTSLEVRLDDHLRLAGALLAAGEWPEREQIRKAYKPHRVAEQARRYFAPYRLLSAVQNASTLAGEGESLRPLFGHALNADWPGNLGAAVADFASAAQPENFWTETLADWQQAESDLREVIQHADPGPFLDDLCGPLARRLAVAPNLLFPGQRPVTVSSVTEVIAYVPPPLAWGTSPPWRYNERPDEVLATISETLAYFLLEELLPGKRVEPLALAAAVLFVRQAEGGAAADQFMLMEKKKRGLPALPELTNKLAAVAEARRGGQQAAPENYAVVLAGLLA